MSQYDKVLNEIIRLFREDDEKDRKSKGLNKIRSDLEGMQYRRQFDDFYSSVINSMGIAIRADFGRLLDSPIASIFVNDVERQHDFLNDYLVLPHALAKLLDYQTNSRGRNADVGKICNLLALTGIPRGLEKGVTIDETKAEFAKAYLILMTGLKSLNIVNAPFSKDGITTSDFLYWLIYDKSCGELNLNMLIELAEATEGSFGDFKSFIVAYWKIRSVSPDTSVSFFYSEILPNIR
jgi:hypothetical protein